MAHGCTPSTEKVETGELPRVCCPASVPTLTSSRFSERHCLKIQGGARHGTHANNLSTWETGVEARLIYKANSRRSRCTQRNPVLKDKQTNRKARWKMMKKTLCLPSGGTGPHSYAHQHVNKCTQPHEYILEYVPHHTHVKPLFIITMA